MFGRPRCREWTPLSTQQLRLRSLIQIVGYNIRPPESYPVQCSFYLTLHHTTMSAPFYTSERICSPHPKWKEIDSEITHNMSSTNVVIRIWCHTLHPTESCNNRQDTVIQTWGVYFSGLRYIGANLASNFTSDCFKCNTLVFQMHGGHFCSYKSLKLDVIPPENELDQGSLSSDSSGRTNLSRTTLESRLVSDSKLLHARSISPGKRGRKPDKEYSKSHSPIEKTFHQNFPTIRPSASLIITQNRLRDNNVEIGRRKENPSNIYEYSPDYMDVKEFTEDRYNSYSKETSHEDLSQSKIDCSETAENYDLRNELDGIPKIRYMTMNFLKSEIRPSYNATKLQKLHLLQYSIKKKQEAVEEIKERIYKKSALTDGRSPSDEKEFLLRGKSRSQRNLFSPDDNSLNREKSASQSDLNVKNGRIKEERPLSNGPRLTLKLNDLLSYKTKPSPFQRAEHVRLTKQIEILRFKRIILSDERDSKLANIRRLKERHAKLSEANQDVGSELMENYHTLSRRTDSLKETRQNCGALRELAGRSHSALRNRRCELLLMLHHIFYVEERGPSKWSIVNVPLPICGDESTRATPVSDSVAAGFVAQATCLAASLLNQPLRYKITLLGSASKILDETPDLPDPNIPLFARGGDTTLFRYALFLLNKCIAQLMWGRGLPVTDIGPTLANLQRLLITPCNMSESSKLFGSNRWLSDGDCPRAQSLRSMVASDRGKYRPFNRFKDSLDGHSPHSATTLRRHRHSKSVGSYRDDQEIPTFDQSTTSIMGSESNIYNMKLSQGNSEAASTLKTHSSDSAIPTMTDNAVNVNTDAAVNVTADGAVNVSFIIGDGEKLVRLTSNNGDVELSDNVKKICNEINDFCSSNAIDIAEYMERRASDIEDLDCSDCVRNENGECDIVCANNVRDVIVIPSAEAILDTGQSCQSDRHND